jgi:hypothetical protein
MGVVTPDDTLSKELSVGLSRGYENRFKQEEKPKQWRFRTVNEQESPLRCRSLRHNLKSSIRFAIALPLAHQGFGGSALSLCKAMERRIGRKSKKVRNSCRETAQGGQGFAEVGRPAAFRHGEKLSGLFLVEQLYFMAIDTYGIP